MISSRAESDLIFFLGIDIGSVSTKLAVLDANNRLYAHCYLPTAGNPEKALMLGLRQVGTLLPKKASVSGVAITGSGRVLGAELISADMVKNEITCQAASALHFEPGTRTVIEIGGQDSKLIITRQGLVTDFGMNTVCAAGTGSFLDHQASRLGISFEEMNQLVLESESPATINATCTVFAESDMITRQQSGCSKTDIVYGLCKALVANFRRSVVQARPIVPPLVFQGGVAHNKGIRRALQEDLGIEPRVPPHPELTGATGAALLCALNPPEKSRFKGFSVLLNK